MKKTIAIVCAALLLMAFAAPSLALLGANGLPIGQLPTKTDRQNARQELKADLQAFRAAYEEIRAQRAENGKLIEQNKTLRKQLTASLKSLRSGGMTLPADAVAQLQGLKAQVAQVNSQLAATKGQVQTGLRNSREQIHARQFEAATAALANVKVIIAQRNGLLANVNTLLSQMISLVNSTTPVPRPSAAPSPLPTSAT